MGAIIFPSGITLANMIIIFLIDGIICGCVSCYLAGLKDYSPTAWFFIGFFFGIFGLITAVGLPLKKDIIPNYIPSGGFSHIPQKSIFQKLNNKANTIKMMSS